MVWVFAKGPGDRSSIPGWVIPKTQKWYLMPLCLTHSIIKWNNPGKGVAPFPTPTSSRYWKRSLHHRPMTTVANFTTLLTKELDNFYVNSHLRIWKHTSSFLFIGKWPINMTDFLVKKIKFTWPYFSIHDDSKQLKMNERNCDILKCNFMQIEPINNEWYYLFLLKMKRMKENLIITSNLFWTD